MIHFFHVTKRFPSGQTGLDDVSFDIDRGEMVFLTGPSGAGKSTLLKMIFREETPSQGQVLVNGRNVGSLPLGKVPYLRRSIGVVFQDFRLIARKTVFENVSYLPRILGLGANERRRLAYQTLRRVGLAHRLNSFPMELSGGEKQRVAIARALINEPEIVLADEPTGNLDPDLAREIMDVFYEINQRGTTVVFATHDRDLLDSASRRVLMLAGGRLLHDLPASGGVREALPTAERGRAAEAAGATGEPNASPGVESGAQSGGEPAGTSGLPSEDAVAAPVVET